MEEENLCEKCFNKHSFPWCQPAYSENILSDNVVTCINFDEDPLITKEKAMKDKLLRAKIMNLVTWMLSKKDVNIVDFKETENSIQVIFEKKENVSDWEVEIENLEKLAKETEEPEIYEEEKEEEKKRIARENEPLGFFDIAFDDEDYVDGDPDDYFSKSINFISLNRSAVKTIIRQVKKQIKEYNR